MMKPYLVRVRDAIQYMHHCKASYLETVPVTETFKGKVVWQGDVEIFQLTEHPKAQRCYAWAYQGDDDKTHYTAVLALPPVQTPQDAVKAAIAAQVKNERKET